jgi:hypothetical protein
VDWFEKKNIIYRSRCFSNSLDHQVISVSTCYMILWFYYVFRFILFVLNLVIPFFPVILGCLWKKVASSAQKGHSSLSDPCAGASGVRAAQERSGAQQPLKITLLIG